MHGQFGKHISVAERSDMYLVTVDYHKYADDTETSGSAPLVISLQSNLQACIRMQSCKLKLRTEKKEERKKMIIVGSSVHVSLAGCESADIGGSSIPFQSSGILWSKCCPDTVSETTHQKP